jgi:predicted metal-dependent phosphoesterase TrpH
MDAKFALAAEATQRVKDSLKKASQLAAQSAIDASEINATAMKEALQIVKEEADNERELFQQAIAVSELYRTQLNEKKARHKAASIMASKASKLAAEEADIERETLKRVAITTFAAFDNEVMELKARYMTALSAKEEADNQKFAHLANLHLSREDSREVSINAQHAFLSATAERNVFNQKLLDQQLVYEEAATKKFYEYQSSLEKANSKPISDKVNLANEDAENDALKVAKEQT